MIEQFDGLKSNIDGIIHSPFLSSKECCDCIEYAHKKEEELKKLNIEYKSTYGKNKITTNLYTQYNFFNDNPQHLKKLEKIIYPLFNNIEYYPITIQSWVNIYRKNDNIQWHTHNATNQIPSFGYTANIFLCGNEDIGLTYAIHDKKMPRYHYKHIKNKLGHIMIFPNHIYHMVRKNSYDEIRYTVGMTITAYNSHLGRLWASNSRSQDFIGLTLPHTNSTEINQELKINYQ